MFDKQNPNFKNSSYPNYPIKNNLNQSPYRNPGLLNHGVAGVEKKLWKNLKQIGNSLDKRKPLSVGDIMGELAYELKRVKRTEFPIYLDPKTASFLDVAVHAKIRQYLSDSTVEKNIRYAKFMEKHPVSIDFRNLTPEQFIRHCDYRIEIENATPHALAHERKAIMMFLRAYGMEMDRWKLVCKTPPVTTSIDDIEVPYPYEVNQFFTYEYSKNKYENTLFQSVAFLGFMYGMRPPSEICNLNLEDIVIKKDGTGYIRIREKKKHGRRRNIIPFNKSVLSSPVFKTPKNYIKNWRYKVETSKSGDALFLQPNGKRVTEKYIRDHISPIGKNIVGKYFHLYTMRHTYATYLYEYTGDLQFVSKMLGHTKIVNTSKYIHVAECIKRQLGKRNLFNLALRSMQRGQQGNLDCLPKNGQSNVFSPVGSDGLSRI